MASGSSDWRSELTCDPAPLRSLMRGTIDGFATQGGSVVATETPLMHLVRGSLVVLSSFPTEIQVGGVDIAWKVEAFPIYAHRWRPDLLRHWESWPSGMEPYAAEGLDFRPAIGRSVEISIISIFESFVDEEELAEIDVAILFGLEGWRLLIECGEYLDHPDPLPNDLVLTTDPETIDAHLARGMLRSC